MFERTALPAGPRVISARLPAARSVSIAAYVLAGSRLEAPGQVGVAHFMEHITFKGTKAYPSTRAISEAIEGVGGSFNAATDRESTVYWVRVPLREAERAMDVIGELIVRPRLEAADIQSERAVIIEEIRSYLDDPSEYCQILFQTAMFGDGPLGREICGEEADILALPEAAVHDFWRTAYRPANTVIAVVGDLGHETATDLAATAFGSGNGVVPGFAAAPTLPAGPRVRTGKRDTSQAQLCLGRPGAPPRPSRQLDAGRPQRGPRRRDEQPAVPVGPRGARARLRRVVGPRRLCRRGRPRGLGRRRPGEPAARRSRPSSSSSRDSATSRSPPPSSSKAKRYLSGGLELRMDDTRHVASWIGGQEALHDRVLTLDEALAAVEAVDADAIQALAGRTLPRRRAAARGGRAGALPARTRGPPQDAGMTAPAMIEPAGEAPTQRARRSSSSSPTCTCGSASLALSRVELETLAGLGGLDTQGLVDLAEVRWRTGDLLGAGEAAAAALRARCRPDPIALVVAAEAASAIGRPSEARRLATRAIAAAPPARSTRSSPGCHARASGRPTPTSRRRRRRRCSIAGPSRRRTPGRRRACRPSLATPARGRPGRRDGATAAGPMTLGLLGRRRDRRRGRRRRSPTRPREFEAGRQALVAGSFDEAALRFGLALRLAPALAPAVLEATEGARAASLSVVRGDAYRLAGHETEARQAYADRGAGRVAGASRRRSASGRSRRPSPPAEPDEADEIEETRGGRAADDSNADAAEHRDEPEADGSTDAEWPRRATTSQPPTHRTSTRPGDADA